MSRRFHLFGVYILALRILASYGWAYAAAWLRGGEWLERRIGVLNSRNARRIEAKVLQLEGLFLKIGQLVSILTNFIPEEFRSGLEAVQDRVPARPFGEVSQQIERELGAPLEDLFTAIDETPMASASLAQVHAAQLADGRRVAVKVQHAEIDEVARIDLRTMRRVLRLVSFFLRIRGLLGVYDEVRSMVLEELDFELEAGHIETIAAYFSENPSIVLPAVIRERTSRRVLTTTFIEGVKITHLRALEDLQADRGAVAEKVLRAYCDMIFDLGIFHADPHPGNLFVVPGGAVAFVDFGAVARLSPRMKDGIVRFLEAVLRRDTDKILAALRQLGFVSRRSDPELAERVLRYFQRRFLEDMTLESWNLQDVQADLQTKIETMADLRRLDVSFRELTALFEIPKDLVLLERTILLLLGLCTHLAPEMNPMRTVRPYVQDFLLGDRDWARLAANAVKDMAVTAITLPDELRRVLLRANRGELEVRSPDVRAGARALYRLGQQALFGILALGFAVLAYVAHLDGEAAWSTYALWASGGCGAGFVVSLLR